MSINNMTKEELELLSYKDITNILLEENGAMSTKDLFLKITQLLELPKSVFENKIGDYYTTLTTDKRFVVLSDGNWDLKNKHKSEKMQVMDDDDSDDIELQNEEDMDEEDEDEIDFDEENNDDDFDDSDDDYKDLVIMDEEELELEQ